MNYILVIGSDAVARRLLALKLRHVGYNCVSASTTRESAVLMRARGLPSLVLINSSTSVQEASDNFEDIRQIAELPVIFICPPTIETDRHFDELINRAEDFLIRPYMHNELLARMRRQLSTAALSQASSNLFINFEMRQATSQGRFISLSRIEVCLLEILYRHRGEIVTPYRLIDCISGTSDAAKINTLRVHIRRLREKLEVQPKHPEFIFTERGYGYKLSWNVQEVNREIQAAAEVSPLS